MTIVSVAQAAHRLGIDAKTLHRWLAEAQLPLHGHPGDGRKKGVSAEQLQVLARLHQRRLAGLPEQSPAPTPSAGLELSDVLLALPERLEAVQAQLVALEQQVAALTHLLQLHTHPSGSSAPSVKPDSMTRQSAKRAPVARAKPPRKPAHVIPRVEYVSQGHYVVLCPKQGLLPWEPDTPQWFAWLAQQSSFRFVGKGGTFSAHHEWRVPRGAWRAHRHIRNRGYHLRLAPTQELTITVLEQAAATFQAHLG